MRFRPALLALASCSAPVPAVAQEARGTEKSTSSDDMTNPVHRVDLAVEISEPDGEEPEQKWTLRYQQPFVLANDSKLTFRMELPFERSDTIEPDEPPTEKRLGIGDLYAQLIYTHKQDRLHAYGFGARLYAPTASDDELGSGKWRLVPMAGYRWNLPQLSEHSYFVFEARYDFSFAGDEDRSDKSVLKWAPTFNYGLPGDWAIVLFPKTEMQYDFEKGGLFIPLNVGVEKEWGKRFLTSLEVAWNAFDDDQPPYDWKLEARAGVFF